MSRLEDLRAEIVAAVDGVAGLHAFARRPSTARPGDAWTRWRSTERATAYGWLHRFAVVVYLPQQTEQSADEFVEEHGQLLADALGPVMYVEEIAPADLGSGDATIYALVITGRTE